MLSVSTLLAASLIGLAAHADPAEPSAFEVMTGLQPRTVFLPALTLSDEERRQGGYKRKTILQLDADVGDESEVSFRLQAKPKRLVHIEFRF